MPTSERITARDEWETNTPMRAESRIKRKMDAVLWLCFQGYTLPQIAKLPDSPCLRTLRAWCANNLLGFGKTYRFYRLQHAAAQVEAGIEADLRQIRAKVERNRAREERKKQGAGRKMSHDGPGNQSGISAL